MAADKRWQKPIPMKPDTRTVKDIFGRRDNVSPMAFDQVDRDLLAAAIGVAVASDCMLGIGLARGGKGITICLWQGGEKQYDYAKSLDELHELLRKVFDGLASTAEDVHQLYGLEA